MGCAGTVSGKALAMRFGLRCLGAASASLPVRNQTAQTALPSKLTAGGTYAAERDALSRRSLLSEAWSALAKLSTTSRASLTLRSGGPATAAVRACAVRSVMLPRAGPAVRRSRPLSSNVRQRNERCPSRGRVSGAGAPSA